MRRVFQNQPDDSQPVSPGTKAREPSQTHLKPLRHTEERIRRTSTSPLQIPSQRVFDLELRSISSFVFHPVELILYRFEEDNDLRTRRDGIWYAVFAL